MPPRGRPESLTTNVPGQSPSFQDEKFIEQLLQLVAENDEASLVTLVAMAFGAEGYLADLKQQIAVDSRLDLLRFCARQKYGPCKTVHVIKWIAHFQRLVEGGCSTEEMRRELSDFVAAEIEEEWKWRQAPPADEGAPESQPPPRSATKKGARVAEKAAAEEAENVAALPRENIYLSKEDVGPLCTYLLRGIIQHAALYAHVANHPQDTTAPKGFEFFIEAPMPAPPLRVAVAVEKTPQDAVPTTLKEVRAQRTEELEAMINEYNEAVAKEELWRKTEQTEREMQILIENEGAKKAVEDTYGGLEADLAQRQRQILRRIFVLEKSLGAGTSPQPA
ncbi:hypothetical protein DQ04_04711020 [Trypanosoma grayi]|uniref:hypothetical protein n=1 Tax=Trypanosoma grayi TaxID=71804 RepID=UPI0004F431E1|nr:hypothetical protein DQ04_04711020 [Trypanosoma grayi]KEG09749.1 hypothetical protein DQ04_04711020 [Trypanosoma grayi]